jgi:hypothetical protein
MHKNGRRDWLDFSMFSRAQEIKTLKELKVTSEEIAGFLTIGFF